jgi:N-acetylmuramoyl-L-alanine amidase
MKKIAGGCTLLIAMLFGMMFLSSLTESKPFIIVVDAGHGGKDPGALGSRSYEKDIALAVALELGKIINDSLKDVKVIFTRKTDVFVELHKRAEIANQARADLFISIHCNSSTAKHAHGSETYVMGLHANDRNMEVAQRENEVISKEDNFDVYEGFNLDSPETRILLENFQSAYLLNSANLAVKIQSEFKNYVKRHDRGIHQAGFIVLWKTNLPSVLVELGFISNYDEEKFLKSIKGQKDIAIGMFNALRNYKKELAY